jgi:hypothetical protein
MSPPPDLSPNGSGRVEEADDDEVDPSIDEVQQELAQWRADDRRRRTALGRQRQERLAATDDPAGDLPGLVVPPGYLRSSRGWRYVATGGTVPGARDVTLARLFSFETDDDDYVLVPTRRAGRYPELEWTWRYGSSPIGDRAGGYGGILYVPASAWQARAHIPFGLDAPELCLERLLGLSGAAEVLGVRAATLSTYLSRGAFAEPQRRIGGDPLWSKPIVEFWGDARPGQGYRSDLRRPRRRRRS